MVEPSEDQLESLMKRHIFERVIDRIAAPLVVQAEFNAGFQTDPVQHAAQGLVFYP